MAGGDEAEPAFASDEAAIAHYRQRCSSLQSQLAAAEQDILEFTESSKELQAELESELERMDKAEKGMRKELDDTKNDKEEWKNKYTTALRDHTATMTHMQRELETLRATEKSLRTKLRDMELDNDDLEKSEREKDSSLQDLETRYNKSLERIALLEEELVAKAQLEEEVQRLKDELRDVNEELVVTRSQAQATTEALKAAQASPEATSSTAPSSTPSSPPAKKAPSPVSTPRRTPSPEASPPPSIELVKPTPGPARGPSRQRRASMIASPPTSISPSKIARPPSSALPFPSPSPTGQTPFRAPLGRSTRTAHLHSYGLPSSPSSPALASPSRSRVASRSGSAAGGSFPGRAPGGLPRTDTATMIRDMQQMTSRVRQLTERLDQRRSNVMRGSAIPRFGSPSTANLAGLARGDGAESPTGGGEQRHGAASAATFESIGWRRTRFDAPAFTVGGFTCLDRQLYGRFSCVCGPESAFEPPVEHFRSFERSAGHARRVSRSLGDALRRSSPSTTPSTPVALLLSARLEPLVRFRRRDRSTASTGVKPRTIDAGA
ncbi:NADH:ubiquinone oxidoreductase [Rhodotorula sphaerocarpa]